MLVLDKQGKVLFMNEAFVSLRRADAPLGTPAESLFARPEVLRSALAVLRRVPESWRRDLELLSPSEDGSVPVTVRAEVVIGRSGNPIGFIVMLADLRDSRRADAARLQLEASLTRAGGAVPGGDDVVSAILTNASLAAMDITEGRVGHAIASLLEEVEASTRRASALYAQIRSFTS